MTGRALPCVLTFWAAAGDLGGVRVRGLQIFRRRRQRTFAPAHVCRRAYSASKHRLPNLRNTRCGNNKLASIAIHHVASFKHHALLCYSAANARATPACAAARRVECCAAARGRVGGGAPRGRVGRRAGVRGRRRRRDLGVQMHAARTNTRRDDARERGDAREALDAARLGDAHAQGPVAARDPHVAGVQARAGRRADRGNARGLERGRVEPEAEGDT
mmetsp:Transcript_2422/g.7127  ORF Transcript_2422/g.7127 Transcript_2422/m.7127 type:complete len:218 (-) Transcript_2422:718-1371(-)